MNTIYLLSRLDTGGPTNQAFNIVTTLKKYGVNPVIVTLFDELENRSWFDKFINGGVEIIQLHCNRKKLLFAKKQLIKIIEDKKISIVHASGYSASLLCSFVRKHCKTISTMRSTLSNVGEGKSNFVNSMMQFIYKNWIFKKIDRIVCCSKSLSEQYKKDIFKSFQYVQNGVDTDVFVPIDEVEKTKLRQDLNLPIDKKIYVSISNLIPRKNIQLMIRAFNNLNSDNCYLLIVGKGNEMNNLQKLANNNPNIKFVGKTMQPLKYYQCADVFVSASLAEGLPNCVLEALSCGLPCILSNITMHEEILEYDNNAGILFDNNSVNALQNSITETLSWDIAVHKKASKQLIDKYLSKYCMAQKYADLYKSL